MSRASFITKNLGANAPPVIANSQLQLTLFVLYIHFDVLCLRVVEGIAQSLSGNPIDIVAQDRIEVTRRALDGNIEERVMRCLCRRKFLTESVNRKRKVIRRDGGGPQALYGLAPFSDRLGSLIDRALESLLGFGRPFWQKVGGALKTHQKAVKGLQHSIVQLSSDACSLIHACFQTDVELVPYLPEADLVQTP